MESAIHTGISEHSGQSERCPCAPGSPQWLVDCRDDFLRTGWINLAIVSPHMKPGEMFVEVWSAMTMLPDGNFSYEPLPHDDRREWCIRPPSIT